MPLVDSGDVFFEMLLKRRPLSVQTKNRANLAKWKGFVKNNAGLVWRRKTLDEKYYFQIIYIYDEDPIDIDNIIKPIQDSLVGLVYRDDVDVLDVSAHRRHVSDPIGDDLLPDLIRTGMLSNSSNSEMVYIRVCKAKRLGEFI